MAFGANVLASQGVLFCGLQVSGQCRGDRVDGLAKVQVPVKACLRLTTRQPARWRFIIKQTQGFLRVLRLKALRRVSAGGE